MRQKTAVITGASGGIGGAAARAFSRDGYAVILCHNTASRPAALLAQELNDGGGCAESKKLDVTDPRAADELFSSVCESYGGIDALINCAGVSLIKQLGDVTDSEYERVFGVNMRGVFNCCRAALPHMIARKSGAIVNVSSIWGVCGGSCEAVYSASKAAVIGFTKALAKEVGPSGITVNCVAPGVIDTPMNACFTGDELSQLAADTPLGRIGQPDEAAQAILYLANARFVTAQTLVVDGGFIA